MGPGIERNLGEQPITRIIQENNLTRHDLVEISAKHITHKMLARACKGRRLTPNTKNKILEALNKATERTYSMKELFNY